MQNLGLTNSLVKQNPPLIIPTNPLFVSDASLLMFSLPNYCYCFNLISLSVKRVVAMAWKDFSQSDISWGLFVNFKRKEGGKNEGREKWRENWCFPLFGWG